MNTQSDPTAALTSLLAILSQTTQQQQNRRLLPSFPFPPAHPGPPQPHSLDPVFVEGDILDTTPWIGARTTPWYEPRHWQLPRFPPSTPSQAPTQTKPVPRLASPTSKRKRSPSPSQPQRTTSTPLSFSNYSQALKQIITQSQRDDFVEALQSLRKRQNHFESDLFEERSRIIRKYESKRKLDTLLKSLGSENAGEEVSPPPVRVDVENTGRGS